MRHYIKRIHEIDIKPALSGETIPTSDRWTEKEPVIRQDFIWGAGPFAIETITKEEFNTDPDTINNENLYTYSNITTCLNATSITAAETSSRQNKKNTKHQKTTGETSIV